MSLVAGTVEVTSAPPARVLRRATAFDLPELHRCMQENFREGGGQRAADFDERYWSWQYVDGPHALVLVAEEAGRLCGYLHAPLYPVRLQGRAALGAMVQDVGTAAHARRRGVFRDLGLSAIQHLSSLGVDVVFAFPNSRSLPGFLNDHGYHVLARPGLMAAPGDLGAWGAGAGPAARALLPALGGAWRAWSAWRGRGAVHDDGKGPLRLPAPDAHVAECARSSPGPGEIGITRDLEFLSWRYGRSPVCEYEFWGEQAGRVLLAFAVTRRAEVRGIPVQLLLDWGALPGQDQALEHLICERARSARGRGMAMTVAMVPDAEQAAWERGGFVRVPARLNPRPFVLVGRGITPTGIEALRDRAAFRFTLGDWDVY